MDLWLEELIEGELEDDSYYQSFATPLKPASVIKQDHRQKLRDFFEMKELRSQFVNAQKLALELLPHFVPLEEFLKIKTEIEESSEHLARFIASTEDNLERPILFQEMLGFSDKTLLRIYDLASDLVNKGDHKTAIDLLRFLTILAPHVAGYWLGLAICLQSLDRHEEAITVFNAVKLLNPLNPVPFVCSIESYKILKDKDKIKSEFIELEKVINNLEPNEKEKWKQKMEGFPKPM